MRHAISKHVGDFVALLALFAVSIGVSYYIVQHQRLRIPADSKTVVFSDNLDVDRAIAIRRACGDRMRTSFGIGTHLTNDFPGAKALNMVIKLWSVNDMPVVKLSDAPGKEQGDRDSLPKGDPMPTTRLVQTRG